MEKLTFRTIESRNETNIFLNKVENYTGVRLPTLYANNSKIVGVFLQDKLVAGYMLVTKPSFRSLMFIPDQIKDKDKFFSIDKYEMMEVNGLWIGPSVKTPKAQFRIWLNILKDVFFSRKKYLLLMSDSRNKTIRHIHSLTQPVALYEGAPKLMTGDATHAEVRIGYTTRWRAVANIPRYFIELRNRKIRASNTLKRRFNYLT